MGSFYGSSCKIQSVKSVCIIRRILNNLERMKYFKIIKYNKQIQKRLNISPDDYRDFSIIKIELIPIENKSGNFINIFNEEDRPYYHIYFDNDRKDKNRYYLKDDDNVKKIMIKIGSQVKSLRNLFNSSKCIESIDFRSLYRTNITDMNCMFYECELLKNIYFTNFNTNNVKDMSGMFTGCSSLKQLNLSKFNTNNVQDINGMFS